MKLGLITVCMILMVGTGMGQDNCVRWLDAIIMERGQGLEISAKIFADTPECNLVTMPGTVAVEIYDDTTKKLVFERNETTEIDRTKWGSNDEYIRYPCKYIPYSSFRGKLKAADLDYAFIRVKVTYVDERTREAYSDEETRILYLS